MLKLVTLMVVLTALPLHAEDWTTDYERSSYTRSPDYAATIDYCRRLSDASPWVEYTTFGVSPQGRDLPLLVVDRGGHFTPEAVRASGNVVCLVQAGIHAGEIDGKDAGLMLVRDIAITRERESLLDGVTLLFIPIYNVDGHERRSRYNRPNQNGPEEMGWRVTAQNLNLNRDYLVADAPETQAWVRLFVTWLPDFFVDCHVTDGADYQYAVTYAAEVFGTLDDGATAWMKDRFLPPLKTGMKKDGFPLALYQWYRRGHDPASGIKSWVASPRLSEGYVAEQNRPGLLIETHSLKDYHTRVSGTYAALARTLEILSRERDHLRDVVAAADRFAASDAFRARPHPLTFELDDTDSVMVDFLGIDYDVVASQLTGGKWFRYNGRPVETRIPYFPRQRVTQSVRLPAAYIVPVEWTDVIARLELHGVRVVRTAEPMTLPVESYRFHDVTWNERPSQGRHYVDFSLSTEEGERTFPAGSAVVDMRQRASRVAAAILEPLAMTSYAHWGFFDPILERQEYIESYVIEQLARDMLDEDPDLAKAFAGWRAEHPDASPGDIRDWFYRRTPYYDHSYDLYPVGRVIERDALGSLLD